MTTLRDILSELINASVELGQVSPVDLEDQKQDLLTETVDEILTRLIGV